jgi:hypothetical protein
MPIWNQKGVYLGNRPNVSYYVTSNLVLNYDAGNSASYPGSGTTWTDLSGNGINGTLNNGPTFSSNNGGSIVFDGTNDNVSLSAGSNFAFGSNPYTIEIWVNANTPGTFSYLVDARNASQTVPWAVYMDSSRLVYFYNTVSTFSTTLPSGWCHYLVSRTSTATNGVTVYINGTSSLTFTDNVNHSTSPTTSYLAMRFSSTEYLSGRISSFRVYKGKGLTQAEVTQNFNAVRGRYGL